MKNRKTWVITGTIGILGVGTGVGFASTPSTPSSADSARTTVTDTAAPSTDDVTRGITLTQDPSVTKPVTTGVTQVDAARTMSDKAITSVNVDLAPSQVSAQNPVSAPSPVSAQSPVSAPSAPSAN